MQPPRPRRPARWLAQVLLLLGLCGSTLCSAQANVTASEYKVKAAYLYKFVNYVQWPPPVLADPGAVLQIGVIEADKLGEELAQIAAERRPDTRPLQVRRLRRDESAAGLHMLFIGRSASAQAGDILAGVRNKPVLTVTESEAAFAHGSMINFLLLDDRVRFDVAPHQGELASLKISARLLAVARKVVGDAP